MCELYSSEEKELDVKSDVLIRVMSVEKVIFRGSKMSKKSGFTEILNQEKQPLYSALGCT